MASLPMVASGGNSQWLIQEGDVTCSRSASTRVYTDFRPEYLIMYATDTADYSNRRLGGMSTTSYGSCSYGGMQQANNSVNYAGINSIPNTSDNNMCQQVFDDGFQIAKMTNNGLVYHWIALAKKS